MLDEAGASSNDTQTILSGGFTMFRETKNQDGKLRHDSVILQLDQAGKVKELTVITEDASKKTFDDLAAAKIKLEGAMPADYTMKTLRYLEGGQGPSFKESTLQGYGPDHQNQDTIKMYSWGGNEPVGATVDMFLLGLQPLQDSLTALSR